MNDAGRRGDFLARVIDRANDRAPVVRPRPTALFEPVPSAWHGDPMVDAAHDRVRDEESRAPLTVPAMATDDDGARRFVTRASTPSVEPVEAAVEPRRREMTPAPRAEVPRDPPQLAAREPVSIERVIAPPLAHVQPTPRFSAPEPARGSAPREPDVAVPNAPAAAEGAAPRVPASEPQPLRSARLLPVAQIAIESATAAGDAPAPRQSLVHETSSATSVTISIGRVEVRAATAPTSPPTVRAKGARAPMRLDEYLERRERKR